MDGYLKIKTKLDNSGIDKDVQELENKMNKLELKNTNLSEEQKGIQQEIDNYERLVNKADEYKNKIKELETEKRAIRKNPSKELLMNNEEYVNIQNKIRKITADYKKAIKEIDNEYKNVNFNKNNKKNQNRTIERRVTKQNATNSYMAQLTELTNQRDKIISNIIPTNSEIINAQITEIKNKYAEASKELEKQSPKLDKLYTKLDKIKAKQNENNTKIGQFKAKIEQINLKKVENGLGNVGQGIQNSISKIGRMAMAVLGVRTAWNAVRSVMSLAQQYNPQISADFEYMRYCIANLVAPAVQWLTQLFYKLLSYVNAVTNAWFGINLFGNSSVKNFKKMQNSMSGTAKSVKEIQKTLQGFDEINVLQDTTDTSGGGVGGSVAPSMDLSGLQADIPKWLKWIIDNKDVIIAVFAGIAAAIASIKIAKLLDSLGLLKVKMLGLKSLGIGLLIAGIVLLIKDIIAMIKDPSWSNFLSILIDIGIIVAGIALLLGAWKIAIVAIIAVIGGLCIKLFAQEKAIKSVKDAQKDLEESTKSLEEANNSYINSVDRAEEAQEKLKEAQNKTGLSGEDLFKKVQEGTLDYKNMTAEQKEVYKAYLSNEQAQKDLKDATEKLTEAKKNEKIASWENKLAVAAEKGQYDEYKNAVVDAFNKGELSAEEARNLIGKSMSEMSRDAQETFMNDLPSSIKNGLDPRNYETFGRKLRSWFSDLFESIKGTATALSKIKFNVTSETISSGGNRGISGGFTTRISMPKLAKGTVLSRATPVIAGEAGKEAIIPLENNTEGLELIADKIASKIGINSASYIIQLDSRTIQRGLAKSKQELAFETNGR